MDVEVNIVRLLQNLLDNMVAYMEMENLVIEDLLIEEYEDDADDFIIPYNLEGRWDNVFDGLIDIIADIHHLEEDEQLIIEGERRVGEGRHLHVDIEGFRTLGDPTFAQHFRMNKATFELLVLELGNRLLTTNRLLRLRTKLDVCLLMALWILGNLSSFRGTGVVFGVSGSVVHFHYVVVIQALRELAPKFIKWPTAAQKARTKASCQRRTGFPDVIGMMDGSLVKITAPRIQRERYFDRHHSYSINVHIVCDHNLRLIHVYVGEAGDNHDAGVFLRSPLYNLILERNDIVGDDEHILADSAYTLTNKVLTPYRNNGNLTRRRTRYNFFHSSSRMPVERSNGHWNEKWRRLYRLHVLNFDYTVDHIMATLMLHNFVKLDGREPDGIQLPPQPPVLFNENAVIIGREHPLLAQAKAAGVQKRDAIALLLTPD